MQPTSTISYQWLDSTAANPYHSGLSLHSHTSHSVETLSFIHAMRRHPASLADSAALRPKNQRNFGLKFDFEAAHWRPPLVQGWPLRWSSTRFKPSASSR